MTTGKKSLYLMISMVVIILGYLFLFLGNSLGRNKHQLVTELGIPNNINEHYLTIDSWIYEPNSKKMEIVFNVDNKSYDGKDIYTCSAISRKRSNIQAEVIVNTRDILVVHLSNVMPNFGEVSLRISYDELTELEPLKVYTNQDDVEIVDGISEKTVYQFYIERNERLIEKYTEENKIYNNEIQALNEKIENANVSISDLQNQFGYKTDAQLKQIESDIMNIQTNIALYQKDIDTFQQKISENENRINNCLRENEDLKVNQ